MGPRSQACHLWSPAIADSSPDPCPGVEENMTWLNDQLVEPSVLLVLAVFPVQGTRASLVSVLLLLAICIPHIWGSSGLWRPVDYQ